MFENLNPDVLKAFGSVVLSDIVNDSTTSVHTSSKTGNIVAHRIQGQDHYIMSFDRSGKLISTGSFISTEN